MFQILSFGKANKLSKNKELKIINGALTHKENNFLPVSPLN